MNVSLGTTLNSSIIHVLVPFVLKSGFEAERIGNTSATFVIGLSLK